MTTSTTVAFRGYVREPCNDYFGRGVGVSVARLSVSRCGSDWWCGARRADEQPPDFGQREPDQVPVSCGSAPFLERITVRKAWANMEGVMCRYQPVYWRTW